MRHDDYVTLEARIVRVKDGAVLLGVEVDGDEVTGWVPRSLLHGADDRLLSAADEDGETRQVRVREWKARQLGWV